MSKYWLHTWDVFSRSVPDKMWKVSLSVTGVWGCSCPKWKFCKAPKIDCHHILKIKKVEPQNVTTPTLVVGAIKRAVTKSQPPVVQPQPYFVLQTKRVVCMEDEV